MEWTHIAAFNLTLLAAIAAPGPALLYLTRTSMAHRRRAGIMAALGLAVMAAAWTLAALLGLQVFFDVFPWAQIAMKTTGGAYLIYIAISTLRGANTPLDAAPQVASHKHFIGGILVNLSNPKSILFASAVIVAIFPPTLSLGEKTIILLNHLAVEVIVQPALAVLLSTMVVRTRYLNAKTTLDRIAATVMGGLGLRLLLDRQMET
ncbi:LysE family translocator [Octadecabacter sp.]|nr:LysE family translocator [Octadecabacter sp.]